MGRVCRRNSMLLRKHTNAHMTHQIKSKQCSVFMQQCNLLLQHFNHTSVLCGEGCCEDGLLSLTTCHEYSLVSHRARHPPILSVLLDARLQLWTSDSKTGQNLFRRRHGVHQCRTTNSRRRYLQVCLVTSHVPQRKHCSPIYCNLSHPLLLLLPNRRFLISRALLFHALIDQTRFPSSHTL
jgi:hypothetical protein